MSAYKLEYSRDEFLNLKIAVRLGIDSYNKTISNLQKNKRISRTEREETIKLLLEERGGLEHLQKFFNKIPLKV